MSQPARPGLFGWRGGLAVALSGGMLGEISAQSVDPRNPAHLDSNALLTCRKLGNATFDGHAVAGTKIAQAAAEAIGPTIIAAHGRALPRWEYSGSSRIGQTARSSCRNLDEWPFIDRRFHRLVSVDVARSLEPIVIAVVEARRLLRPSMETAYEIDAVPVKLHSGPRQILPKELPFALAGCHGGRDSAP